MTGRRLPRIVPALALALTASIVVAWAFWSAPGAGTASATSGSLAAATVSVPASSLSTVTVTWTQQASLEPVSPESSALTYSVERRLGSGSWAAVAGGGCSGAMPHGTTSCTDAPPATGGYGYRVVASYRTWTATSSEAGPVSVTLDTAPPTVAAQLTPAPNAAGWNSTSPVAVALSADDAGGSGVAGITYTDDGSDPTTSGTAQVYAAALSIAASTTLRYFAADLDGNASAVQTQLVKIDIDAPANALTLSGVGGGSFKSGATVYYRGVAGGSFTLTNAVSDSGPSGPASSASAALAGFSSGWAHSASLVSAPPGGPYVSSAFSWSALSTTSPGETITGSDTAGNTAATALTFTNDSLAPAGGTVDATGLTGTGGRYSTSTGLSIAFSPGTDAGSGLAAAGAQLLRASASLGDGSCGAYGAYAQVGANDPASPAADTVPVDHTCYRYRYVVVDRVGNQATYTSPDIKVDTSAAHPDFLQPITSPETVRAGPARLAAGDVDNDGDQDIVTANLFAATSSVLINDGVGSFRERTVVSNAGSIDAGLGRFDADGNLDLVLLYQQTPPATGALVIFKGGGDGSFTFTGAVNSAVSTGVRPTSLAVGDFNGDAIDDVAVVNSQNDANTQIGTVATYLGTPAGNDEFSSATPAQTHNAQIGATDVAFADFDGGARDLVVTNSASSSITFLSGNGSGFGAPTHIAAGAAVFYLDTAHLDAGANRDIVATVANSSPSAVRTLFGNGASGFPTQATTIAATAATGANPFAIVAEDLDGDGDADVAITNAAPSTVSVLANDGTGGLTIAPASPEVGIGAAGTLPYGLVSADFDGSGYDDLAATPLFTDPGQVRLLLNQNGSRADLSINLTDAPDPVPGGQSLTYSLTVANAGPGTPSSVKATNELPAGVTFDAAASSPSCSAAGAAPVTVTCDYGALAQGSPESQQIVVTTSATTSTPLLSTATVAANLADATPTDNISAVTTTVLDVTGPSGGSVDAAGLVGTGGRYSTSTALSIVLAKGTDPAGLAASGAQLRRSTATLGSDGVGDGSCGGYAASAPVGAADPVSPAGDTVPAGQACYRYEYVVADALGNSTTYTSPDIKVDTSAPAAPALAFSAFTSTYWSGSALFYRSGATSGAFTVTAGASDATSGISSYAFPILPAGWSASAGALGVHTYSWSAADPTAPSGVQSVTATNNATLTSPAASLTLTSDITAPATGTISYTDGYVTSPSVSVSFTPGSDGGSGLSATSRLLQRADATLGDGTCGGYGVFATVAGGTNPSSPFADASVASGNCYQYRYLVSDNVGNQATYGSSGVARADSTPPAISRAVASKADGSTAGTIRQGGDYHVYAQVTDDAGPPAVTANASSFDTGVAAASLSATGGPWTVGGQGYNHRSATLTANTGLTTGATYNYTVTAADAAANTVGPTTFPATIETYDTVINATIGLISFWRFNEPFITQDEFTDTAKELSLHVGQVGATWTPLPSQTRTALITSSTNRLRMQAGTGFSQYYASATPSANNLVQADVYVASTLAGDEIGVVGRQAIAGTGLNFYYARYANSRWELLKVLNGAGAYVGTGTGAGFYTQTLTSGSTYELTLQMSGSTISLLVDGVSRITGTDASLAAAGRGGVRLGTGAALATSDTAGLQLDNIRVSDLATAAADGAGTNPGTYSGGLRLNEPGALAGDSNRAAQLDGVNDHVTVPDASSLDLGDGPLTLEAWVKRPAGGSATSMCLFDKGAGAFEFCYDANKLALLKNPPTAYIATSGTTSVTDTGWHHLVGTKTGAATKLYIDGVDVTALGTNETLASNTSPLIFGAVNPSLGGRLDGLIDEFAIYNAVLPLATILDHYKAGRGTG